MEKPELRKVIEKLEHLDIREWEFKNGRHEKSLIAKTGGLTFYVYVDKKYREFREDICYYCLSISDREETTSLHYLNPDKDSIEQKEISKFYKKVYNNLTEYKKNEFFKTLKDFFSE